MNHELPTERNCSLIAPEDLSAGLGTKNSKLFKYKLLLQLLTCNFHPFDLISLSA